MQHLCVSPTQVALMTSFPLVPTVLAANPPDLRSGVVALAAGASQRAGRALACGVLLSSTLLAGWTPDAQAARARAPAATPPQRAEAAGGNPPSYDVFGKRYRVLASSDGYRESGVASWYGHPFDGRPTSSGEMYDMHEMTAAHRTLPIPTWVEVTNLTNGKRVIVKVNDRGPFVGKRVIDLSYAAATALDMVQNGTARVEVRALAGPPPETTARRDDRAQTTTSPKPAGRPEPAPPKSSPDSSRRVADGGSVASAGARSQSPAKRERSAEPQRPTEPERPAEPERLFAEAGKFTKRDDAVRLVNDLRAQGVANAFVVTEDGRRRSSHRVRVGPLPDAVEVESMNDWLRRLGAKHSRSVAMR